LIVIGRIIGADGFVLAPSVTVNFRGGVVELELELELESRMRGGCCCCDVGASIFIPSRGETEGLEKGVIDWTG
jgi:hypothetical protein